MTKVPRGQGFSPLWRASWRFRYVMMHVLGPASLDDARDPRHHMRLDRARRQALHAKRLAERRSS